ncbi:Chloroplast import component protein (Tic20) [compost metagenome]
MSPFKSSTGLYENVAAFLCYLFAFVGGVIFLAVEKRSRFVLFHALQSVMLFAGLMIAHVATGFLPLIGIVVGLMLNLLGVGLWLLLMLTSLQGKWLKLPWIGELAERQLNRM